MGLSSYSYPADAGMLCLILVNTAISISMIKEILCSIIHLIMSIHATSTSTSVQIFTDSFERRNCPEEAYMDEFRSQTRSSHYKFMYDDTQQECPVCLMDFKPDAEVDRLSCGHVFHKSCLEKWVEYWNVTCPLCRNQMMVPKEVEEDTCPM